MTVSVILLSLAALFSGITVISIIVALQASREQRNTIFPLVRENEGIKARRAKISIAIFSVLTALCLGGWVATQQNPNNILIAKSTSEAEQNAAESSIELATADSQSTQSAIVQATADPSLFSEVPTNTPAVAEPTAPPNPTATPLPTATPVPVAPTESPSATPRPLASPVPAPEGASLGPIVFAVEVDDNREALNPEETFSTNDEKVYAVFPYSGMKNGLPFSAVWYYENREILRDEYEWSWGISDRSFVFIKPARAGNYSLELMVGDDVLATAAFEVLP